MSEELEKLRDQATLARTEIKNLRLQIAALKHEHQKNINQIKNTLERYRCRGCAEKASQSTTQEQNAPDPGIIYKPIGYITCGFASKRAVPRQPNIVADMHGTITLDTSVFNNPEHALSGLEEFSHIWIIFDMHLAHTQNAPSAAVSPPRLRGERTGVFSTRSPHRPCPLGLSLVKIVSVLGNQIIFEGVDMVNGTPVLDIKPFIPQYDTPMNRGTRNTDLFDNSINDSINIDSPTYPSLNSLRISTVEGNTFRPTDLHSPRPDTERGAPDGQERVSPPSNVNGDSASVVRVPQWITERRCYEVRFSDEAFATLLHVIGDRAEQFKSTLQSLLAEDPRSEYVRTRYPNSEYSCVLEEMCITCVFNDANNVCTVISVSDDMQGS